MTPPTTHGPARSDGPSPWVLALLLLGGMAVMLVFLYYGVGPGSGRPPAPAPSSSSEALKAPTPTPESSASTDASGLGDRVEHEPDAPASGAPVDVEALPSGAPTASTAR